MDKLNQGLWRYQSPSSLFKQKLENKTKQKTKDFFHYRDIIYIVVHSNSNVSILVVTVF